MIEQIRPRELAGWLKSAGAFGAPVVLDVREPHELAIASVKPVGFDLLTIPMHTIPLRLQELQPGQPVAVLCHHGGRSMQVAMYLQQHGFEHVSNISGGIHAWADEIDPTIPRY